MVQKGDKLDSKAVGARIKRARLENDGMTQRELGDALGIESRSISMIETGRWIPYRHMSKLESVLNRPAAWFLYGDEYDTDPSLRLERKLDRLLEQQERLIELLEQSPPKGGGSR